MTSQQKDQLTMFAVLAIELVLAIGKYCLLYTATARLSMVSCAEFTNQDLGTDDESFHYEDEHTDEDTNSRPRSSTKRNRKRVLSNTKYYFLQYPQRMLTSASQLDQTYDQIPAKSDYNYEYQGHVSPNTYKSIHIHSAQPLQYHGQESKKDDHFWPLLLLSFLPLLFGSLILLPLLISFFTQILQLLAMMQNTMNNMNSSTTQSSVLLGKRRRRHISKLEVKYYPYFSDEIIEQLTNRLRRAVAKFKYLNAAK